LFITKNTLVIKADVVKIEKQENEISPTKKR
jgi:hypothetical protein